MLASYTGSYATLCPEWSKGWGYTYSAAWQDDTIPGAVQPAEESLTGRVVWRASFTRHGSDQIRLCNPR